MCRSQNKLYTHSKTIHIASAHPRIGLQNIGHGLRDFAQSLFTTIEGTSTPNPRKSANPFTKRSISHWSLKDFFIKTSFWYKNILGNSI